MTHCWSSSGAIPNYGAPPSVFFLAAYYLARAIAIFLAISLWLLSDIPILSLCDKKLYYNIA